MKEAIRPTKADTLFSATEEILTRAEMLLEKATKQAQWKTLERNKPVKVESITKRARGLLLNIFLTAYRIPHGPTAMPTDEDMKDNKDYVLDQVLQTETVLDFFRKISKLEEDLLKEERFNL